MAENKTSEMRLGRRLFQSNAASGTISYMFDLFDNVLIPSTSSVLDIVAFLCMEAYI
jgi:hypothetical protein